MHVPQEISRDLVDGRMKKRIGECSGTPLYSYDEKYWFSTPMAAYRANLPDADPALILREEILGEFNKPHSSANS